MSNNRNNQPEDLSVETQTFTDGRRGCAPIPIEPICPREYRLCVDANGCRAEYPVDCRDPFWPEFSHPRWLTCAELYSGMNSACPRTIRHCTC